MNLYDLGIDAEVIEGVLRSVALLKIFYLLI